MRILSPRDTQPPHVDASERKGKESEKGKAKKARKGPPGREERVRPPPPAYSPTKEGTKKGEREKTGKEATEKPPNDADPPKTPRDPRKTPRDNPTESSK